MLLISALIPPIHNSKSQPSAQARPKSKSLARVVQAIQPDEDGQVYFEGTYWSARFYDPKCKATAAVGDKVKVVVRDRLPLLVMPLNVG